MKKSPIDQIVIDGKFLGDLLCILSHPHIFDGVAVLNDR